MTTRTSAVPASLLALLLAFAAPGARAADSGWTDPGAPAAATLVFRNNGDRAKVRVVVADTEASRVRGLGGRSLAAGEGILYDFRGQRQVRMWTRDDRVPLDMAFLGQEGVVSYMRKDLPPGDATPIPSRVPVRYVLEVPAGTLTELGIAVGDAVEIVLAGRAVAPPPAAEPAPSAATAPASRAEPEGAPPEEGPGDAPDPAAEPEPTSR